MATFLLVIIYLAFISLGLPDSLLGSAWPIMRTEFSLPVEAAGWISLVVTAGTIVSSLSSSFLIRKFGVGRVTFVSVLLTAGALFGFTAAPSLIFLLLLAVPLGLGGGAVDAALNGYVAEHYKARHMSWLHCFWGIGATGGPVILSAAIAQSGWRGGYTTISIIQFCLAGVLLLSLPLWRLAARPRTIQEEAAPQSSAGRTLSLNGERLAMLGFFLYCGVEIVVGLWSASYLVGARGISPTQAAAWIAFYYGGITAGRALSGFASMKWKSPTLIRVGLFTAILGTLLFLLPLPSFFCLIGLVLIGVGFAPIYPCMLHETPARFGPERAKKRMGLQMACAYTGSTLMPPLTGLLSGAFSLSVLPWFILIFVTALIICTEAVNHDLARAKVNP